MIDDPDYVTELDIDENGPWVECGWGYTGCTGADYAAEMVPHQGEWMCPTCQRTAIAEWADDVRHGLEG